MTAASQKGYFIMRETVYGRQAVKACLSANRRRVYLLRAQEDIRDIEDILRLAHHQDIPVERVSRDTLNRLASHGVHQGVLLEAEPVPREDINTWLSRLEGPRQVAVALDGIEDPRNFGAIIRSAAAFGAAGILFTERRQAPLSPAAVKAAAGGVERVPLVAVKNLPDALNRIRDAGFWSTGLDMAGDRDIWQADLSGRIMLVAGGEGRGLRRLVRERCDFLARIPLWPGIESLNVSVAAAIALAAARRGESPDAVYRP